MPRQDLWEVVCFRPKAKDEYVLLTRSHDTLVFLQDQWKCSQCLDSALKKKKNLKTWQPFSAISAVEWFSSSVGTWRFQDPIPTPSTVSYLFLLCCDSCLWQLQSYYSRGTFKSWERGGPSPSFGNLRVKVPGLLQLLHEMEYVIDNFVKFSLDSSNALDSWTVR